MKYCKNCLQPDTRPNTRFSEDGICPACEYYEKTRHVDWEGRFDILKNLSQKIKVEHAGVGHNCILGVSGGKDSTRQALWLRDKVGLKPLLVCLGYPPEMMTDRGANNISNLIDLGFDVVVSYLSPVTWKDLMRESFLRFVNHGKAPELALFATVPQIAMRYSLRHIFWGENPGLQLGDMKTLGKTGYDGNNLRMMNTLSGGSSEWLLDAGFSAEKLIGYSYPSVEDFDLHRLEIIYLGWFLGDWGLRRNAEYSLMHGLEIRSDTVKNTGDLYGVTSLDDDWVTLNQMIKYYKFGFGRVTDYVNEEIRLGEMTRLEGVDLVERYDDACGANYIESFSNYIGISVSQFWEKVHDSVNRELFNVHADGRITRKFKVGVGL